MEIKVEDDFRKDNEILEAFAESLDEYSQMKFKKIYQNIMGYQRRIDELRAECDYHKAQCGRRQLAEEAITRQAQHAIKELDVVKTERAKLENIKWVRFLRWLKVV